MSLILSLPAAAHAEGSKAAFVKALDRMMVQLGRESARDSRTIRNAYRDHLDLLVLDRYAELERALANGGLAPLPADPLRFNLAPRLTGAYPIGEKDLENQTSYIAARPSTIGCLLDVASRVTSGPLEVTSLVRHTKYQGALKATNTNATTSVPMHTMGLAFDIALVNTPLETVYEIRDVLRRMRAEGKLLFIGERKQLVFHVVPNPSRLGHFNDVYARALGAPAMLNGTHVVAFSTPIEPGKGKRTPKVKAEIVAVLPTHEFVDEWFGADPAYRNADHAQGDVEVPVSAAAAAETIDPRNGIGSGAGASVVTAQLIALLIALLAVSGRIVTNRTALPGSSLHDYVGDNHWKDTRS